MLQQQEYEPIDVSKDPFAYSKDFDPEKPGNFEAWLKMRPTHISEEEWPLRIALLQLCLESKSVRTEHDRVLVILGWKARNGLLPPQD